MPFPYNIPVTKDEKYHEELCGCCSDCGNSCFALICAPCYVLKTKSMLDGRKCTPYDLFCGMSSPFAVRQQLRAKFGIKSDPKNDCTTMICCAPCMICQDGREVLHRYDKVGVTFSTFGGKYFGPISGVEEKKKEGKKDKKDKKKDKK